MAHPLVDQLRFTRTEWLRALDGIPEEDGFRRFMPMNSIGWTVAHLAWQEQRNFLTRPHNLIPVPILNEVAPNGGPATTPSLTEMLAAWKQVTEAVDPWLESLDSEALTQPLPGNPPRSYRRRDPPHDVPLLVPRGRDHGHAAAARPSQPTRVRGPGPGGHGALPARVRVAVEAQQARPRAPPKPTSERQRATMKPFRLMVGYRGTPDRDTLLDQARRAESIGFTHVAIHDHLTPQLAPIPLLTAVGMVTERLGLVPLVFNNDLRHPAVLAQELATLDQLSNGRLTVGLGAGWNEPEYASIGMAFDPPPTRIARMAEAVTVIKGLFAPEPFTFHGRFYESRTWTDSPSRSSSRIRRSWSAAPKSTSCDSRPEQRRSSGWTCARTASRSPTPSRHGWTSESDGSATKRANASMTSS